MSTYALTGLLGGMAALVAGATSPLVLAAALLACTASLAGFSYLEARQEQNLSVTGVVAGILTFILGAYATLGSEIVAVAAAVATAILGTQRRLGGGEHVAVPQQVRRSRPALPQHRQLPVCRYERLIFSSSTGIAEALQFSRVGPAADFVERAWRMRI